MQSNVDYITGKFDVACSLHACGVATDLVLGKAAAAGASFACCPCCYGSLRENHVLTYPKSEAFRAAGWRFKVGGWRRMRN